MKENKSTVQQRNNLFNFLDGNRPSASEDLEMGDMPLEIKLFHIIIETYLKMSLQTHVV